VNHHTVFGDLRLGAAQVYRLQTQASIYILGVHEARGRKYVILRGQPGSDREHVVVRDSDPRIGEASLFELPCEQWLGKTLEVATMTTSEIAAVAIETDPLSIASVSGASERRRSVDDASRSPWARPVAAGQPAPLVATPGGMEANPRVQVGLSIGTLPAGGSLAGGPAAPSSMARQIVVGQRPPVAAPEPGLPYPDRHVRYAEDAAALLRSISNRDRIFDDLGQHLELRTRLRRALDDCAELLKKIRARDQK
jgi:hypothetical protein